MSKRGRRRSKMSRPRDAWLQVSTLPFTFRTPRITLLPSKQPNKPYSAKLLSSALLMTAETLLWLKSANFSAFVLKRSIGSLNCLFWPLMNATIFWLIPCRSCNFSVHQVDHTLSGCQYHRKYTDGRQDTGQTSLKHF